MSQQSVSVAKVAKHIQGCMSQSGQQAEGGVSSFLSPLLKPPLERLAF